jgi:hypothetical protein
MDACHKSFICVSFFKKIACKQLRGQVLVKILKDFHYLPQISQIFNCFILLLHDF